MISYYHRLQHWYVALLARLRERRWKIWLLLATVTYVLLEAARSVVSDASTLLVAYALQVVAYLAKRPMGLGGLAIVGISTTLLILSWIETRPKPRVESETQRLEPIDELERRQIQDLRTVWNRHGAMAVGMMVDLLEDAVVALKLQAYWAPLLEPVVAELKAKRDALEGELSVSNSPRIARVRDAFNDTYQRYLRVIKWVALLRDNDSFKPARDADSRIAVWRQQHRDFREKLLDLCEDPAHRGALRIFVTFIEEPAYRAFLTEAESTSDWLELTRAIEAGHDGDPRGEAATG